MGVSEITLEWVDKAEEDAAVAERESRFRKSPARRQTNWSSLQKGLHGSVLSGSCCNTPLSYCSLVLLPDFVRFVEFSSEVVLWLKDASLVT